MLLIKVCLARYHAAQPHDRRLFCRPHRECSQFMGLLQYPDFQGAYAGICARGMDMG
jgi:hypothetical protein